MTGNAHWRALSFTLERADYMKFRTNTYLRPQSLLCSLMFLLPVAFAFAAKAVYGANDWSYFGYSVIVALAIYYLYMPWLGQLTLLDNLKRSTSLEQVSQVEVDLVKFSVEREDCRQVNRWARVFDIRNTRAGVYVMVDSSCGVIIPARAFENPEEQRSFFWTIQGYWRANVQAALKAKSVKHE